MAKTAQQPYLDAIKRSLQAAICLRNFASQDVERHNKPEIEVSTDADKKSEVVARPIMIARSELE